MHQMAASWPVVWASLWGLGFGFLAGYGLAKRNYTKRNHTTSSDYTPEVELAVTQDPHAWPLGREWAHLDGAGRRYIISRYEDLGSISVISVGMVRQWRVYGRPA